MNHEFTPKLTTPYVCLCDEVQGHPNHHLITAEDFAITSFIGNTFDLSTQATKPQVNRLLPKEQN